METTETRQARMLLALALLCLILTALSCSWLAMVHEEPLERGGIQIQEVPPKQ